MNIKHMDHNCGQQQQGLAVQQQHGQPGQQGQQGQPGNPGQQGQPGQPGPALIAIAPLVIPAINVIVPSQLLGMDRLPTQTQVTMSEGTNFQMNGVVGQLVSQNGHPAANTGSPRRIRWPVGTIFYLNDKARNQCVINPGHQEDTLPMGCSVILPAGTQINWGGRLVVISQYESTENCTVTLN